MTSLEKCPKQHLHTKRPDGYVAWQEWAEKKSRRHYQVQCPGCGRWSIWRRKAAETSLEKFERMIKDQRRVVFLLWLQKRKGAA